MKSLRYYAEFFSSKNKKYRVEIHTENPEGSKQIELAAQPVAVEYNADGRLYFPTLMSQASINIITHAPLIDLFTGKNQGVEIRITDLDSNKIDWFGYFSPNTYSSDYNTDSDALSLEAIDTLASLENIRYGYLNGSSSEFVTFKDVLLYILDKADPGRVINNVYIQKTLRLSQSATTNVWDDLLIQEVNFYDELDEAMTLQDVLKEMMKFLGMTIIQYQDSYYIIDHNFVKAGKSAFFFHNRATGAETSINIPIVTKNLYKDIGVYGANANVSIGDLYNKQTIRANRLNVDSVIPDIMDDGDLINQNANPDNRFETPITIDKEEYVLLTQFLKSKGNWRYLKPTIGSSDEEVEVNPNNIDQLNIAAFWQNADYYKSKDSEGNVLNEPSKISWKKYITFASKIYAESILDQASNDARLLSLNSNQLVILKGGYFIINLTYRMSSHRLAHSVLKDDTFAGGQPAEISFKGYFEETWIPCRLSIEDYYYDGEKFVHYDEYNLKVSRGYYTEYEIKRGIIATALSWYKHTDQYGYWKYVTKEEYETLPSGTKKETGKFAKIRNTYPYFLFTREDKKDVYIEEQYYFECYLRDRFLLLHKNKEGDKIFGEDKHLTNTVSYKMNLIDSEDGMAIKLPEDRITTGTLIFEVFKPNHLGVSPTRGLELISKACTGFHISEITLKYTTVSNTSDPNSDDTDIIYSNIIDSNNVQEADDIELYINTYKDRAAYSSVIIKKDNGYDFLNTLYSEIEGGDYTAEDFLIDKLCDHYEEKRYIYENDLNRKFDFLTKIYEDTLNTTMLVHSISIDYATDSCRVKLIEP